MPNKIIRDLFTGELKEVPFEGSGVLARIPSPGAAPRVRRAGSGWPMTSEAAAINPEDVPQEREILKQHGVTTEYTRTGEPIFRSRAHRKAHCEAVGLYDRNGGDGDPMPKNYNSSYSPHGQREAVERLMAMYD